MNKIKKSAAIFASFVAIAFIVSACNPICECTSTFEGTTTEVYDVPLKEIGLKKCTDLNYTEDSPYGRTVVECTKKK
jgi:hypothetical protein